MPRPIITLTSDFGTADGYVAAMKGVIMTLAPDARSLLEMMDTLSEVVAHADVATSDFVLLSLRSALGRVYHRFPAAIS